MLIDTHCHLDFKDFDLDREKVISRAKLSGVGYLINIGSSLEGSLRSVELSKKYKEIFASVGIHPHDAKKIKKEDYITLKKLLKENKKIVAIGEIGLDYYKNLSPKDDQEKLFENFLEISNNMDLPVIIHSREAHKDTVSILKSFKKSPIRGVMHCFSGDEKFLNETLNLGLYISFTCNITFKNAGNLRELVKLVPIERLLLETDAPFLSPENLRGKRNEPANLRYLVKILSQISKFSEEDIARITTHNAKELFNLRVTKEKSAVTYNIKDSLYINLTNRCTNNCSFCIRNKTPFVKWHNLKLEKEPTAAEILNEIKDPNAYREIVFCGYGEPTIRLDTMLDIARVLKKSGCIIRLVTNGQGNLINNRSIIKEMKGLIDKVSVSLNVDSKEKYNKFCRPEFGENTYDEVKKFIKECKSFGLFVEVTCLDLPGVDLDKCASIAKDELGVNFRLRRLDVVG